MKGRGLLFRDFLGEICRRREGRERESVAYFFFHIVARCRARARALSAAHGQKPPPVLPGRLAAEEAPAEEAAEVSVRWAVLRLTLLQMVLLLLR